MHVTLVTPEQSLVTTDDATGVFARSPEGEFGILRGHIPFLAALVPGRVAVVSGNDREELFVPGGFLEASGPADDYHVIVLADDAERVDDIDSGEARRRLEEARRSAQEDSNDRTEAAVRAAEVRVEMAER